ncbi:hypothetical protein BJX65DRAFT_264233 [Aspergillus insuetus]
MVYRMELYVDGGCRHNGCTDAIGAAAVSLKPLAVDSRTTRRSATFIPDADEPACRALCHHTCPQKGP